jgi:hypothetical protein
MVQLATHIGCSGEAGVCAWEVVVQGAYIFKIVFLSRVAQSWLGKNSK